MATKNNWIKSLCALACLAVVSASAPALIIDDATILIDRALNSPTLTIRYSGASAALVELRINGVSFGTRNVNSARTTGETNFTIDLKSLSEGDNDVEVRLYDKNGKLVGSERSVITSDDGIRGPVYLVTPKVGASLQGTAEIKVGFGREMRNSYVSFFVNNQFRSMTNSAPFSFYWDTTREANGWHEVEAVVVDEQSQTFRTRKVKVFVNNPGGQTTRRTTTQQNVEPPVQNRQNQQGEQTQQAQQTQQTQQTKPPVELTEIGNPGNARTSGQQTGTRTIDPDKAGLVDSQTKLTPPTTVEGIALTNENRGATAAMSGLKSAQLQASIVMGQKDLVPTGSRVVPDAAAKLTAVKTAPETATGSTAKRFMSVDYGQRIPHIGAYTVVLNSRPVAFDVEPRVENGIPLTPFRHLFEHAGGEVEWEHIAKTVQATGHGRTIFIRIGDRLALVNDRTIEMELAAFLDRGRTIVPLSFIRNTLDVEVEYDAETGHVLITNKKN
jgi:hypothetical protein